MGRLHTHGRVFRHLVRAIVLADRFAFTLFVMWIVIAINIHIEEVRYADNSDDP